MNRHQLAFALALGGSLSCSSTKEPPRIGGAPSMEGGAGAPLAPAMAASVGGSTSTMGMSPVDAGAGGEPSEPTVAEAPEGGSGVGGASERPDESWPGNLVPTRAAAEAVLNRLLVLYQGHASAAFPAGTHHLSWKITEGGSASAGAKLKPDWWIDVGQPLLTRDKMTLDIFSLFVCHELGHIVGGYPFKTERTWDEANGTASAAEGQADYFAAKDCLPRLWAHEVAANTAAAALLDEAQRERCASVFAEDADRALCARILFTSLPASQIFEEEYLKGNAVAKRDPRFDTPDTTEVDHLAEGRTPGQCRLDTLVAGALCDVKAFGTGIPGYVPPYDDFSEASEVAARPFACQDGAGARPRCWFLPNRKAFDCAPYPTKCLLEDGVAKTQNCTAARGVDLSECFSGGTCEVNAGGEAECIFPEPP